MQSAPLNPSLVLLQHGRLTTRFPLPAGTASLGRGKTCDVVLGYDSISRVHAEITVSAAGVELRDLGSSNGTRVNGVPRKQATLQDGDKISFGSVGFQYVARGATAAPAGGSTPPLSAGLSLAPEPRHYETQRQAIRLPDARPERHLAAFYHLCSWITDGVDQEGGLAQWLDLLVESLRAHTVHYYGSAGKLDIVTTRESEKPRVKFAPYLLEKFCQLTEATAYAPRELDRFQQRLGNFHYLVAPLRPAGASRTGSCPIVVALRPAEWEPFSAEDRVLMQSACQLWLRSGSRAQEVRELKKENEELRQQTTAPGPQLLGQSEVMRALRARIERVAATKATVLITGETGSGKEVVAHALHARSPRAKGPFIKVNCASIPASLMESELFGHLRGAFTDARADHKGKFLLAHGGTIFLDEIGEMPIGVQAKLLRVLETGEVERLGSEKTDKVDVRILAATNRDLRTQLRAGAFREDLLYRLEVARIIVPPLREHAEDIDELAPNFLRQFCTENGLAELTFSPDALAALRNHPWPGNVREFRNVIQRVAMEADGALVPAALVRSVCG